MPRLLRALSLLPATRHEFVIDWGSTGVNKGGPAVVDVCLDALALACSNDGCSVENLGNLACVKVDGPPSSGAW